METFATPANFLSENAAPLPAGRGFFTLEKRDRGSSRARTARPARGLGRKEAWLGERVGDENRERVTTGVVEFNGYFFFRVIYYRREFERTRAF